jgi:hypothetical protein
LRAQEVGEAGRESRRDGKGGGHGEKGRKMQAKTGVARAFSQKLEKRL